MGSELTSERVDVGNLITHMARLTCDVSADSHDHEVLSYDLFIDPLSGRLAAANVKRIPSPPAGPPPEVA